MEDEIKEWYLWLKDNPDLAEKYFPERMQEIRMFANEPVKMSNLIRDIVDHFPYSKIEAEKLSGLEKQRRIEFHVFAIDAILTLISGNAHEIVQATIEKLKPDLLNQKTYWEKLKETVLPNQQGVNEANKLGVKQIALIHIYEDRNITRKNADQIASLNGYNKVNSGEGLFQDYIYYCSRANRIAIPDPFSTRKLKNKIELFQGVVEYLSEKAKLKVINEIEILKNGLESN